jgi:hypothetical protein
MVRALACAALLCAACQTYSFSRENRPCDESGGCLPGYVCNPVNKLCVAEGSAQDCQPKPEIACNGVDEDCNGTDLVATGTVDDCGGCNDSCKQAFVAQPACVNLACTIVRCEVGHVDANGDPTDGCEKVCPNVDGDNVCDDVDTCIDVDGDGLGNGTANNVGCGQGRMTTDSNDMDPHVCADTDSDGCDDCSSGTFAPANDGIDLNHNGICNVVDTDEDGDTVAWNASGNNHDIDDGNSQVCRDLDMDTCDDCAGPDIGPNTATDGPDFDHDGLCDAGDPDDNDTVPDVSDVAPMDQTRCQDLDDDSCDDCTYFATYSAPNFLDDGTDLDRDIMCADGTDPSRRDCDDGIPNCTRGTECADHDGDFVPECMERFCTATFANPNGATDQICLVVPSTGITGITNALTTALTRVPADPPTYILINDDHTISTTISIGTSPSTADDNVKVVFHQRIGKSLLTAFPTGAGAVRTFDVDTPNAGNEFHFIHVVPGDSAQKPVLGTVFYLHSGSNVVMNNTVDSYAVRGVRVDGDNNIVAFNNFLDGTGAFANDGTKGTIVVDGATGTRIFGNVILGTAVPALAIGGATNTTIDHNTFFMRSAYAEGDAMLFYDNNGGPPGGTSTGTCARNNILTGDANTGDGISYTTDAVNAWSGTCSRGNIFDFPSTTPHCDDNHCENPSSGPTGYCACLSTGFISGQAFNGANDFKQTGAPASTGFLCLKGATVNNAAFSEVTPPIDLNGPWITNNIYGKTNFGDNFNGTNPEPGAREHKTQACP